MTVQQRTTDDGHRWRLVKRYEAVDPTCARCDVQIMPKGCDRWLSVDEAFAQHGTDEPAGVFD